MSDWARPVLHGDSSLLLSSVEAGLTVRLITTFDPFYCEADDDLKEVVGREDLREFDHVPVKEKDEIVGLLHRSEYDSEDAVGHVREAMCHLRGDLIISADAGILSYIEGAARRPCRLVLRGSRLDGIVTLSDLQRLPVRPTIFLLITHLELLMVAWLRERCERTSETEVLDKLSDRRKEKLEEEWERLKTNNLAIDRLSATQFCDKRELLIKHDFPVPTKGVARKQLEDIEGLRDSVAHAGDYALTRDNALSTVAIVRNTRQWIDDLERELSGSMGTEIESSA
ncbi:MAG: hypothetical protein ACR2JR_11855 [Rubrobacteraceae bacterium]